MLWTNSVRARRERHKRYIATVTVGRIMKMPPGLNSKAQQVSFIIQRKMCPFSIQRYFEINATEGDGCWSMGEK